MTLRKFIFLTALGLILQALSGASLAGVESVDAQIAQSRELEGVNSGRAEAVAREALALARQERDRGLLLRAIVQAAHAARTAASYPFALQMVQEGLALAKNLNDSPKGAALLQIRGATQWNQASLVDATNSYVESLRIAEALGDKDLELGAHAGLGLVCSRSDDAAGAMFHFNVALNLARERHDVARLASVLNHRGNLYLQRKAYPEARQDFEEALNLSPDPKDQRALAFLLLNLGQIASDTGDQALATQYLDRSMAICEPGKIQRGIADIECLRAAVERRSGRPDAASAHLEASLRLAEKLKNPDLFAAIYAEYGLTQEARGDFPAALKYERLLAAEREIMRGDKIRRNADEIQARYANEARSREIKLLQRDRDLQQADLALKDAELRHGRSQRYALVALFALALAAVSAGISRLGAGFVRTRRMLLQTTAEKKKVEAADALKARLLDVAALELSNSEARFRSAFEHSALGLALLSPDGGWLSVNAALCRIVGYTAAELKDMTFQEITHPDDLECDLSNVNRLLRGEIESYHMEKRYIHKSGRLIWAALDVSLVRDFAAGKPPYFISQVCDITENKDAAEHLRAAKEEAERANSAKSEFLSRISHELRTPLNAILGFGQLLGAQDLGRRPNESVGHILTAGQHLLGLINEVLDLAKIESGKLEFAYESAPVAGLVVQTLELVRPLAAEAGVRLRPIISDDGSHAAADPRRLKQILLNLLSNAIKYNRPGGDVGVRWRAAGERVRIEVEDTGLGIAPGDIAKIGAPFARLTATESAPGTGLGLSLTRALTEAMGGAFGFSSEVDVGSTFWVELPLAEAPSTELAEAIIAPLPPELLLADAERSALLYIEDNLTNLQLVEHLFADDERVRLITAMRGQQGLELAREERPNLILLDLHLPDLSGESLLRLLAREPSTADIPVIVVSADATPARIERLRLLGACDYLTKPFDIDRLRAAIRQALKEPVLA